MSGVSSTRSAAGPTPWWKRSTESKPRLPGAPINLYRILDVPIVYRVAQEVLAPGARDHLAALLAGLAAEADGRPWLDVGCGPRSLVPAPPAGCMAIDRALPYVRAVRESGRQACVGDAARLPFPDGHFGAAWTIGLLHHLDDATAGAALGEMARVVGPGGRLHVMDAVLPEPAWARPLAWAVRRLDRGRFMRRQAQLTALLPRAPDWRVERHTYTATGLELLVCSGRLP